MSKPRNESINKNPNTGSFPWIQILLILFWIPGISNGCGLFEKKYPKPGEFCNVLVKPVECIQVDFTGRKIQFSPNEKYSLKEISRIQYEFIREEKTITLLVNTENRVQLSDGRFFLRRKDKK
jgi:hypothetical protein